MSYLRYVVPIAAIVTALASAEAVPTTDATNEVATITVTAKDFEFNAPARVTAGAVNIRFVNAGKQPHHGMIVRLDEGKTVKDLEAAFATPGPLPAWAVLMGGPNAPDPGGESNATVVLRPGRYAFLCLIPDAKGPHFMQGMVREFEAVAPSGNGELPSADISLQLTDYEFKLSKPLTAGRHTIRVRNYASQPHEIQIFRVAPGKTFADMKAWAKVEAGPPPGTAIGGVAPLNKGFANNFTADFAAGEYVVLCFVPDVKDGKSHHHHGMIQAITVK